MLPKKCGEIISRDDFQRRFTWWPPFLLKCQNAGVIAYTVMTQTTRSTRPGPVHTTQVTAADEQRYVSHVPGLGARLIDARRIA